MSYENNLKVTLIGGSFYGNKGAQLMTEAAIHHLRNKSNRPVKFFIWVEEVEKNMAYCDEEDVILVPFYPLSYVLFILPVLWIYKMTKIQYTGSNTMLKSCLDCDFFYDISGVSFLDSRPLIFLIYDILNGTPARLFSKKRIKASQAFGLFKSGINKYVGPFFLKKYHKVYARGLHTANAGIANKINNISNAADLGFSIKYKSSNNRYNPEAAVAISVSSVVLKKCRKYKINYIETLTCLCEHIQNVYKKELVIIPHSQKYSERLNNNDIPVARLLKSNLSNLPLPIHLDETIKSPQQIRDVISSCSFLVASRFHAMVNALASEIPVLVLGWSHKYDEVLQQFHLYDCHISFKEMNKSSLIKSFDTHFANKTYYQKRIAQAKDSVYKSSLNNFDFIKDI